mmetsp:Transcript_2838/g.11373  ORF Transcript_2838/g.11373 Transcript_2838/m.11373 type:complete len:257 (+) Transcript_2838:1325-2095(+)
MFFDWGEDELEHVGSVNPRAVAHACTLVQAIIKVLPDVLPVFFDDAAAQHAHRRPALVAEDERSVASRVLLVFGLFALLHPSRPCVLYRAVVVVVAVVFISTAETNRVRRNAGSEHDSRHDSGVQAKDGRLSTAVQANAHRHVADMAVCVCWRPLLPKLFECDHVGLGLFHSLELCQALAIEGKALRSPACRLWIRVIQAPSGPACARRHTVWASRGAARLSCAPARAGVSIPRRGCAPARAGLSIPRLVSSLARL